MKSARRLEGWQDFMQGFNVKSSIILLFVLTKNEQNCVNKKIDEI